MAGLIRTFLTGREKHMDHLVSSFETYIEQRGFKKNPKVVYATNISKITNVSESLKDRAFRKHNFVHLFNFKNNSTVCGKTVQEIELY